MKKLKHILITIYLLLAILLTLTLLAYNDFKITEVGPYSFLIMRDDELAPEFNEGDFFVFGPESRGLPAQYVTSETALTIPMKEGQRSLNLSNSVAIVAYEHIRQLGL